MCRYEKNHRYRWTWQLRDCSRGCKNLSGDRTDQAEAVGALGLHREQLADVEARNGGLDGIEKAPVLDGGVGLHVVGVLVGRAARKPQEDHGGVGILAQPAGLAGQRRQARTCHGHGAQLEEPATGWSGAVSRGHDGSAPSGYPLII